MNLPIAHFLSNWINPALVVIWIAAIFRQTTGKRAKFVLASIAAVVICYCIAHGVRSMKLHGLPREFPSGHEALGASVGASFAREGRWWLITAIVLTIALAVALVVAGYHEFPDVIASLIVSPIITVACHKTLLRKSANMAR